MMRRAAFIAMALLVVASGEAQAFSPEDDATAISERVMSPFCEGVTLHDCPSDAARALTQDIEDRLRSGRSVKEVEDWLVSEYGAGILAAPPAGGFNLLAWLLPAFAVAIGGGVAWLLMRRWVHSPTESESSLSAEDRGRLDQELARMRAER